MANSVLSPLTNTSDTKLIRSTDASRLICDWKTYFSIDISQELAHHPKINLYQCNQTKLKFFSPTGIEGSGEFYEKLQHFDWYYMSDKWEHQVAIKDLTTCKKILEIGSGFGDFVQKGIAQGLNIRGIELNEAAVVEAQKRALPVEAIDLHEISKSHQDFFDGVCSFQVLEHVSSPKEFIDSSLKLLQPGGKLIYCVPNAESYLKHQYNLLDMPPHHMTRWSKDTFEALENLFPVQLEKVQYEPLAVYHISDFLAASFSHWRSSFPASIVVLNSRTLPIYKQCLTLGARRLFKGQSLYVQFRKVK